MLVTSSLHINGTLRAALGLRSWHLPHCGRSIAIRASNKSDVRTVTSFLGGALTAVQFIFDISKPELMEKFPEMVAEFPQVHL